MMKNVSILLVEDNPADVVLTKQSFEKSKLAVTLSVTVDGEEALEYLNREGKYSDVESPDMILLDLNLPKVDGREVLAYVKSNEDLKKIPVVVLTSSMADQDIVESYAKGANCYVQKPVDFETFKDIISKVEEFWFTVVKLPKDD